MKKSNERTDRDKCDGQDCDVTAHCCDGRDYDGHDEGLLKRRHASSRPTQLGGHADQQRSGDDCVHRDMDVVNATVLRKVEQVVDEVQATHGREEARESVESESSGAPGPSPGILRSGGCECCTHVYRSVE
jgi:hypothetical protein